MFTVTDYARLSTFERCRRNAAEVVDYVIQTMGQLPPSKRVGLFVVETPVYNRNVKSLMLQSRFFQQVCSDLWRFAPDVRLLEIHNAQSKKNGTGNGNATKDEVAEAMYEVVDGTLDPEDYSWSDWYAICDAMCHAHL